MQSQSVIALTDEQRKTTLTHWFELLELEDIKELVSERHPSFKKEIVRKHSLKIVTSFGDWYWVYKGTHKITKKPFFFCIVHATKFVVLNLRACSAYYRLFEKEIDTVEGYDFNARCQVFLCTTYTVGEGLRARIAPDIFPCLYRFIALPDLYVNIGSKTPNSLFGLAFDYKINHEISPTHSNGLSYAVIYDSDVIARMLNANENDVITHRRLLWENGTAYPEIYNRCVKRTASGLNSILPDGKCFGHMYKERIVANDASSIDTKNEDIVDLEDVQEEEDDDSNAQLLNDEDYDSDDADYIPEADMEDENDDDESSDD